MLTTTSELRSYVEDFASLPPADRAESARIISALLDKNEPEHFDEGDEFEWSCRGYRH